MVILDPGHGFNTEGKRSPVWEDGTQLFEWEFNRDIARAVKEELSQHKIKSVILVKEAIDIPLYTRANRANNLSRQFPGSFLISIHGNAGGGRGWEVWTCPGQTESDKLATKLYQSAKYYLKDFRMRHDYSDGDPDKEARFTILTKTVCPAVLTENLFFDNRDECRFMLSETGQRLITKLHVDGIINYMREM